MREMIAKSLKSYAGKPLSPGDRFNAEDEHVRTLTVSRLAQLANEDGGGSYLTREMSTAATKAEKRRRASAAGA